MHLKEYREYTFGTYWFVATFVSFIGAAVTYSLISHRFTGAHGRYLSPAQFLEHTVALLFFGYIVLKTHVTLLGRFWTIHPARIWIGIVLFMVGFWSGWFPFGGGMDTAIGYTILGSASWLGLPRRKDASLWWLAVCILGFGIGAIAGDPVARVLQARYGYLQAEGILPAHIIRFTCLSFFTGLIGGLSSSYALTRLLDFPPARSVFSLRTDTSKQTA